MKESIVGFYNIIVDSDIADFDYATEVTDVKALNATTNNKKIYVFFWLWTNRDNRSQ
jgi:hypothetical protein